MRAAVVAVLFCIGAAIGGGLALSGLLGPLGDGAALSFVLAAPAVDAGGEPLAVIRIHPEPTVVGPTIRLGDIADIEAADPQLRAALEQLEIGRAPLPGQSRLYNEARLRVVLRREQLPEARIAIEGMDGDVAVTAGPRLQHVLVAAVDIPRHQPLASDLVTVAVEDASRLTGGVLRPGDVADDEWSQWRATRFIRAGTPLDLSRIGRRPAAERGDAVTVVVRAGAVEVIARGTLLADARVGEIVAVRVDGGGQSVEGVLVAPDRVELVVSGAVPDL